LYGGGWFGGERFGRRVAVRIIGVRSGCGFGGAVADEVAEDAGGVGGGLFGGVVDDLFEGEDAAMTVRRPRGVAAQAMVASIGVPATPAALRTPR
jgi:hypothetical protein